MKSILRTAALTVIILLITACASKRAPVINTTKPQSKAQAALEYLKGLEGKWVVQGGKEGVFGWEFDITSRGGVVLERLKVGTATEMTTVYHLDKGMLVGNHFCQLGNQPHLTAIDAKVDADLNFICDGHVGNTKSHAELHMHGVHFKKNGDQLVIWMDMLKNGEVAFQTSYTLTRAEQ